MHSRKAKPPVKFGQAHVSSGDVPVALLKQARRSGQLNLSSRGLKMVPATVWHVNSELVGDQAAGAASFDTDDKWWDQTDLIKLILASNELKELSEDIALLPALNVLDVHNNQLTKLPMAIAELKQLTRLILSHNQLTDVGGVLGSLVNLQCLRLDHNQLHNLHDNILSLIHLEQLDISYNHLSTLPVAMENLQLLRQLIVDHNQLTELPAGMRSLQELTAAYNKISIMPHFSNCPKLERLDLKNNMISEFPSILPGVNVKELYLGGNKITSIPGDRLLPLVALVMLDLRDNKISSIPGQMSSLERIERLDLTNNELTSLPYVMGKLQHLKFLGLDGNPMKSIRRDIINRGTLEILKHLRSRLVEEDDITDDNVLLPAPPPSDKLVYSGKKTSSIPDQFWDHPNTTAVTIVDLSQNQLTTVPDKLMYFTHICELQLSSNKLALLPAAVGSFTHLTILDLRSNHLSSLPTELAGCQQLREIFLSMNKFQSLPEVLYSLKSLENVFASDNQITDINVAGLNQLSMIACLDLQNNNISHVPPQLGNVTTLRSLQLSGNPFQQPRSNILAKGTPTLLAYLRDRIPK